MEEILEELECVSDEDQKTGFDWFSKFDHSVPVWNGKKSKPRVIFLDIDGVLNYEKWRKNQTKYFEKGGFKSNIEPVDERKVKLISKIIRKTGAKVVLSSSWRFILNGDNPLYWQKGSRVNRVKLLFSKHKIKISDRTGFDFVSSDKKMWGREFEIHSYLQKHPEIKKYAIIDDAKEELEIFLNTPQMFLTKYDEEGITGKQADEIIKYLNS
ncbi:MAG: hypothetical protein KBT11_00200 [Treponema sp.]|nr:hypothetical protein [Candidatus Treponema equifaecale]